MSDVYNTDPKVRPWLSWEVGETVALPGADEDSFTCACFWGREVLQKDFKISSVRVDTGRSNLN